MCARHCCTCISQIHKANDCACVRECVRVCVFASSEEGTGSKNNMYKNYNLIFNFQIKFSFGRVLGRGGGVKGNTELNWRIQKTRRDATGGDSLCAARAVTTTTTERQKLENKQSAAQFIRQTTRRYTRTGVAAGAAVDAAADADAAATVALTVWHLHWCWCWCILKIHTIGTGRQANNR